MTPTTIIIPAAGEGSRFKAAGFTVPKPLIRPRGRAGALIEIALEDARLALGEPDAPAVILIRPEHRAAFEEKGMVNVTLVDIPAPTDGAASTIQYAQPFVGNGPVFVVNSDQTFGLGRTAENQFALFRGYADSVVLCFESDGNSKWSYFDPTTQNIVEKPLEPPKGNYATVGAYWVWHKEMLFEAIHEMKFQDYRVNGEFYFAPALNFLQRQPEPLLVDHFFGLGTPEDLLKYEDWLVGW